MNELLFNLQRINEYEFHIIVHKYDVRLCYDFQLHQMSIHNVHNTINIYLANRFDPRNFSNHSS